jgi:hypothetical protein
MRTPATKAGQDIVTRIRALADGLREDVDAGEMNTFLRNAFIAKVETLESTLEWLPGELVLVEHEAGETVLRRLDAIA